MRQRAWNLPNLFWITAVHAAALLAIPYFSWEGLAAVLVGVFVLAPLGINVGYHRLLSHRAFTAVPWLRYSLATLGAVLGGGPPLHWAAMHRVHHRYSDTEKDPHDSNRGFWYSHVLHLFELDDHELDVDYVSVYAPDLAREPYLVWLNKHWLWPALAVLPLLYLAGGLSLLLWGTFVRLVLTWHIMWLVNSAAHMWGYRSFETPDRTRNSWWVGLLAAGEGWHNNHHANPSCAAHGLRWWELDQSWLLIRAFERLGLASEVKRPPPREAYGPISRRAQSPTR